MLHDIFTYLHSQPLLLIFLALGLGAVLGRVKLGIISLGSTASTLIIGLILSGAIYYVTGERFSLPGILSTIFLELFIFAIGLKVGPQFFSSLKSSGLKFLAIGFITATLNFLIIVIAAKIMGLAPGFASGIISGSYTITAVIGVASGAVDSGAYHLPAGLSDTAVKANIAAGYAITYVFATLGIILMVRYLPNLFGIDPIKAGAKAEANADKGNTKPLPLPGTPGEFHLEYLPTDIRAYRLDNSELDGLPAKELGKRYQTAVINILRDGNIINPANNPILKIGDEIAVFGCIDNEVEYGKYIGPEISDSAVRDVEMQQAELVVLNAQAIHETLTELQNQAASSGFYVRGVFRQGLQLPLSESVSLQKGDIVRVYGSKTAIILAEKQLGGIITPSLTSDSFTIALGMVAGFLIGSLSVKIAGIPFGLGTSGGVILAAMILGWWRTHNPRFGGPVQESARALLQSIGLDLFIAVLALNVAPNTIDALQQGDVVLKVFILGFIAALLPAFISWLVGYYIFKMDPIILAGAVAGSRNSTPALNAIQEQSRSNIPAVGYPIPYALTAMIVLIYGYLAMLI